MSSNKDDSSSSLDLTRLVSPLLVMFHTGRPHNYYYYNLSVCQYTTVDDLPSDAFERHHILYALVERVIDGDTMRVRHIPGYNWRRWNTAQPLPQRSLVDHTLIVRLYGVDCPEVAKFGKPNQPWAQEAKEVVTRMVLHRMVRVTFYRKDQYRRAICKVETVSSPLVSWIPGFRPKDLSVELATAGLAELYTGGGAEYCGNRAVLEQRIERAKRRGLGFWSEGGDRVSAADFKRHHKQQQQQQQQPNQHKPQHPRPDQDRATASKKTQRKRGAILDSAITGLEMAVG